MTNDRGPAARRLPVLATLVVAAAIALMVGLGIWQLERLQWKRDLLARYAAAQGLAPIPFPASPDPANPPLFRRSSALCEAVTGWRAESGRNLAGEPGWIHVASCRPAADEPPFDVVMGWSQTPTSPEWKGGPVTGVIGSDREHLVRLVAADAAPGLQPARPPSLEDVPNNHLFYAIQWFFFAGAALVIYLLALRRRKV